MDTKKEWNRGGEYYAAGKKKPGKEKIIKGGTLTRRPIIPDASLYEAQIRKRGVNSSVYKSVNAVSKLKGTRGSCENSQIAGSIADSEHRHPQQRRCDR